MRTFLLLVMTLLTTGWAAERIWPDGFAVNVKDYGAYGDGLHDDTAAIRAALDDGRNGYNPQPDYYAPRPRTVYFPSGTYLVSGTISWTGIAMTLIGQGATSTIFKLADNASGFGNAATRKPVFTTQGGNFSFRINFFDLGIDTGRGNPGATGIDYIANNVGSIRDVAIRSGDGQGVAGIDMTRQWPGPCLVKNLHVHGFDTGIDIAHGEYGPTFENLMLSGQRVAGIRLGGNVITVHNLVSNNSVPAVAVSGGSSHLILLGATCLGGSGTNNAIQLAAGQCYVRGLSSAGYGNAIGGSVTVAGPVVAEYHTGTKDELFASPDASLNLPIAETPSRIDNNPANWQRVQIVNYSDGNNRTLWQQAFDAGKPTVYTRAGIYLLGGGVVTVPAGVRQVVGFDTAVNSYDQYGLTLEVSANSSEPLIVEGYGYGVTIVHKCSRTVVLKNGYYGYRWEGAPGVAPGDVFFEDAGVNEVTATTPSDPYSYPAHLTVSPGQRVWARQLNIEQNRPHLDNNGGKLVVMGLKTERRGQIMRTRGGGQSEFLGTLIYNTESFSGNELPAFENIESSQSIVCSFSSFVANGFFPVNVRETRGGVTLNRLGTSFSGRDFIPLFAGFITAAPANAVPTVATPAAASPSTTTGTTTSLNALGADDGGEANLTYTWVASGSGPGAVSFAPNGSNTAKATTATFHAAGTYAITVVMRDQREGAVSSSTSVTVIAVPSAISVTPFAVTVASGGTQLFTASASTTDQFGQALTSVPTSFTWSVGGLGTIVTGTFTSNGTTGGPVLVSASASGTTGTADLTVAAAGAPVISSALSQAVAFNASFTYTITASNSPTGFLAQNLPPGFSRSGAVITGSARNAGTYHVTIGASNASGTSLADLVLTVGGGAGSSGAASSGGGGGGCGLGGAAAFSAILMLLFLLRLRR